MAKQTFTTGQVLTAAQMTSLQQTAMSGGAASAKTASYTLVAADAGTAISMSSTSATTITVNTGLFAAGDTVFIQNLNTGICTITAGTATVNTSASLALAQYAGGTLYFTSASAALFFKSDGAAGASALQVFTVNETQADTTQGGTFTLGAWRTRTLNTSVQNTITGASLASNQFILPAGTYYLTAFAPCWKVGSNNARIYNISDSSVVAIGNNQLSGTANTSSTTATVAVTFTIAGTKTFELQHYASATLATQGFGAANGNGYDEIYSSVTIVKVG